MLALVGVRDRFPSDVSEFVKETLIFFELTVFLFSFVVNLLLCLYAYRFI